MITFVPDARGLDWETWVASFVGYNGLLRSGQISPHEPWQDFVQRLTLIDASVPRPETFESWQDWTNGLRLALGV